MAQKSQKPLPFSKTVAPAGGPVRALRGRPRALAEATSGAEKPDLRRERSGLDLDLAARFRLEPLVREWLVDLQVLGRSPRTIDWYSQKLRWYLSHGEAKDLAELTAFELKRYLAELQARGLADNTVHGHFEVLKAFANWACRENYPVDPALLRVRAPKVAQQEMETYSPEQLQVLLKAAPAGWARTGVEILLGTGMRVGELCALTLEDVEDEGDATFLKIRRGKGAKFRRVPVSRQLRRELIRYLNRERPNAESGTLLVLRDGRPVTIPCVSRLFGRLGRQVGFKIHAHKFRHTFATEYLRRGGEIERLRRILGHTTYVMVMRYVHLDKGDLYRDFEACSPF